jgi:methylmalonyl-CoA/ethylmalonyl-CoA epimerase
MLEQINFHHFGLAVKDFTNSINFYSNLGFACSKPIIDEFQKVELILCTSDRFPAVELIRPINSESPIYNFLKKNEEIIYHTCYEVSNPETNVGMLFSKNRAICISKPKPAILFANRLVSFYYLPQVGIVEILNRH